MAQSFIIPPRPEVLLSIQKIMRTENPCIREISQLLKQDITLYSLFLSAANNPWMRLKQPVTSIEHGVTLLGLERVYTIIQAILARNTFKEVPLEEQFWNTAIDVASICSDFANRIKGFDSNHAYSVGMFHNIGIAIMTQRYPEFQTFIKDHEQAPVDLLCIHERHSFETDHYLQGALIARQWSLGEDIAQTIRYQSISDDILTGRTEVSDSVAIYSAILVIAKNTSHEYKKCWSTENHEARNIRETELALNYLHIKNSEFNKIKDDIFDEYMSRNSA